jgi:hypothetical protein
VTDTEDCSKVDLLVPTKFRKSIKMVVSCGGLIIFAAFAILLFFSLQFPDPCSYGLEHPCGVIFNQPLPFVEGCVNPRFEIICENNKSVIYFNYGKRQASAIIVSNSSSSSFRYIITGVSPHNNCPVINSFSLPYENVSFLTYDDDDLTYDDDWKYMMVMRCKKPVYHGGDYWDISTEKCGGEEKQYYSYVVMNGYYNTKFVVENIEESCRIEMKLTVSKWDEKVKCNRKCGYTEVHSEYVNGIELRWRPLLCDREGKRKQRLPLLCILYQTTSACLDIAVMRKSIKLHCYAIFISFSH